jgi:DNA-binding CsgD family transcriptional regulator
VTVWPADHLGRGDLAAVLDFLAEVDDLDDREPYTLDLLRRVRQLIPCAVVTYQEVDLHDRRFITALSDDPHDHPDDEDDEAHYWSVGPCPLAHYRARTGDLTTIRMSDVIGRVRWHEQPVYRDYFRHFAVESFLDLGLGANRDGFRSVILMRERDDLDFSERDRAVLELLRPHFRAREARAALRQALLSPPVASTRQVDGTEPHLTTREREIVALVAAGMTNAEIAAELWVTPGTVKKHLENVYLKLGVGSRAAAANLIRTENAAG